MFWAVFFRVYGRAMTDLYLEKYVPCPADCGWPLCYLARMFDECAGCGTPLPESHRVNFDLTRYTESPEGLR